MFCKNCGVEMNDNQAICVKCGVPTGEGSAFCANCGSGMTPGAEFCMNCGVAVKKSVSGNYNGNSKLTILLVCYFLGSIGIHNFLLGETKKGVLKIIMTTVGSLLCGIGPVVSSVLAIVEFFKIAIDTYVTDPEKFF